MLQIQMSSVREPGYDHFHFYLCSPLHMGPEHASREKILSLVNVLFSWTKMYIELDSKRSKPGVERDLRKTIFFTFPSNEKT